MCPTINTSKSCFFSHFYNINCYYLRDKFELTFRLTYRVSPNEMRCVVHYLVLDSSVLFTFYNIIYKRPKLYQQSTFFPILMNMWPLLYFTRRSRKVYFSNITCLRRRTVVSKVNYLGKFSIK